MAYRTAGARMAQGQVHTMTFRGVEVSARVTLGQIIQVVVLIVAMVAFVIRTEGRVASMESAFGRQQNYVETQLVDARSRLSLLEIANARTEQKFENILESLDRIEKRLTEGGR